MPGLALGTLCEWDTTPDPKVLSLSSEEQPWNVELTADCGWHPKRLSIGFQRVAFGNLLPSTGTMSVWRLLNPSSQRSASTRLSLYFLLNDD